MVAKVLEFLLLEHLELVFLDAGLPHINQSAYRRAVSCEDAVFATQEIVAKYLREGSRVYMCLYDLQRAFDSVEYLVLLEKLFDPGVNGKMWRLLKSWYDQLTERPTPEAWSCLSRGSMTRRKSAGDSTEPCFTPHSTR